MIGRKKRIFFITTIALLAGAFFVQTGQAQKSKSGQTAAPSAPHAVLASTVPVIGHAVGFAETRPVREIMAQSDAVDLELKEQAEEINELNTDFVRTKKADAPAQKDGALQSAFGPNGHFKINIPAPLFTFEGVGVNGSAPPDTTGAVGPNDYMEAVNGGGVRIYDKSGNPRGPAFRISSLFAPLGGVAANTDNGDALILYDRMANRWLITQFAFASSTTPPFHQPMAVSKTGDPTGAYWVYDFIVPGNDFPDYGKIGSWPDGYYFSDRQFTNGSAYNGFGVFAFDRAKMLVGDSTASYIYFNAGPNLSNSSSGIIPSDYNGLTPPPAGEANVFSVYIDDAFDPIDGLRLFDFHADFAVPGNSTFTERPESPLPVAAFDSNDPPGRTDIEEPAPATSADYLDSIGDRLMLRLQYINRGGQELLTTCHTVNATPNPNPTFATYQAATRHYILQKTSPGGAWSVLDQATYAPDTTERWMGSTALDNAGNLAVGYSTSSTSVVPSITYSGRLATDPPNTLGQGEATMFAGTGVQTGTGNRWGDYTAMNLDPSDDSTFWYCNEYYNPTGAFLWRTRIGTFKYASTTAPAQGTLSGTITACDTGAPLKDALVKVSGGPSAGFSSATKPNGTYAFNLSPGSYSVTVVDPAHNCSASGPFNVTITNGATTTLNQCLSGVARFAYQSNSVLVSGGNGNGIIEANECNNLNVAILNDGCLRGSGISATLSSSTPGVTVTQPNSPYPSTNEGATSTNSIPFQVSTSAGFACGTPINFTLTTTYAGGSSTASFTVNTCSAPAVTVNGSLTAGDLTQEGRMGRNAVASVCGTAKACPGIFGSGNRRYDVLTFPNGPAAACATITTTAPGGAVTPVVPVAYLNSYVPPTVGNTGTICTNYLGDPGGSPNTVNSFSVDVPANATLVVVVEDANATQVDSAYTVQVSGLVGNGSGPGPCGPAPTAVSRKVHGGAGTFDIPLPLTGAVGIEDRVGNSGVAGSHTIVLSFSSDPTGATATVAADNPSSGTGSVSSVTYSGNDMIVNLTNVSDQQTLTLSVTGGTVSPAVVPIGFLVGDVNGNRSVSSTDVSQVKAASGATATAANFRADVNAGGTINGTDVSIVKSASGHTLP
ncbi:MAG: dockerin type I domain-containing protein [Chthoniobacterales bacterium]